MLTKMKFVFIAVICCFICQCSTLYQNVYVEQDFQAEKYDIAVLPLQNYSLRPDAGIVLSEYVYSNMKEAELFNSIMEPTLLRYRIQQEKIDINKLPDHGYAKTVGEKLGVNAIVYGVLSEYDYQHNIQEDPTVSMTLHFFDMEQKKVIWTASSSKVGKICWGNKNLGQVSQEIIAKIIKKLEKENNEPENKETENTSADQ